MSVYFAVPVPLVLHKETFYRVFVVVSFFVPMLTEMPTIAQRLRWHRGRLRGDKGDGAQTSLQEEAAACANWKRRQLVSLVLDR